MHGLRAAYTVWLNDNFLVRAWVQKSIEDLQARLYTVYEPYGLLMTA